MHEEEEITELDLAHHSLDDVPPTVFALERTLETLILECNNIGTLPVSLFHCHGLKRLSLSDNDLHVLPEALSNLSQLVELNLSKNILSDVPDSIKQCKNLISLDLSVNPLQKIPEGCTQLLNLSELYLNDTFLEFLPANFGRLAKLRILELRENSLNTLPKSLSRLVSLIRLDLGQNDVTNVPEVIGSLRTLKELWLDGNKIKNIPYLIGNLTELVHLDISNNRIESISDSIGNCKKLIDLSASTNELKSLSDSICNCDELITLKVDENALKELPSNIGRLKHLEELFCNQNYLNNIPPSIGLCRKLHTLNADDNDLEYLPKDLGSCVSLRILSVHGNHLTYLPAELGHISNLSVMNITANAIRYLPVSFMKLTKINALWISENQNKPLIQLIQDSDPTSGRRVLTHFLLPQVSKLQSKLNDEDSISENGSFHASVWEEERRKKSTVKWASVNGDSESDKPGNFRREPTPFPKEMRAMAKRVHNLRTKNLLKEAKIKCNDFCNGSSNKTKKVFEDTEDNNEARRILLDLDGGRDSGIVSEEITPDSEDHPSNNSIRKPSDPLPLAPTPSKFNHELEELRTNVHSNKRPPPYHIAAAMSKHASNFIRSNDEVDKKVPYHYENHTVIKRLEKNISSTSHISDESECSSTSPSSLQTVLKRPLGSTEEISTSDIESVKSHANKLRQVSEQLLLLRNGGSSNSSSLRSSFVRLPDQFHQQQTSIQQQNGLLSTIEQVSQASDDDEDIKTGFTQGILRPPGTMMPNVFRQHNYENVGNNIKPSPAMKSSENRVHTRTPHFVMADPPLPRKATAISRPSSSVINTH
ncbi:Erbin,Protein lap4,Leucine-rich repeat-containing protein 1,Leucine-rich repeat-containing protein 7 [Lepeophtheirus salmonis]|uniref:Erbin,Protein lap4,Leucine-rich repeat-containing protein 1,Leucine-rich repeat-containing protein 7 n=1 Tax=Lepeophtheirus salmonis TaxID=72036 RepID=A0A7R8CVX5_LEPSM|nr:Erbin,Protein lap4,Leucine-rich repeat-containing protein 1,Leucine-rich repeat-containing protein 7 [Lepeophtheirus salmonis]CAF2948518.1 Erbin,Protein lap4,Leucine-rich repeat-containing protein 1,Leucine-rich repeat-containing protein 7 [Lepeophtheirus salmonis]